MVDVHPVVEGDDGDEGVMRAGGTPAVIQQRRFYVMNNYISHSGLAALQYTAFFNRCRLDGANADQFSPTLRTSPPATLRWPYSHRPTHTVLLTRFPSHAYARRIATHISPPRIRNDVLTQACASTWRSGAARHST
jgi:hypothetical protein